MLSYSVSQYCHHILFLVETFIKLDDPIERSQSYSLQDKSWKIVLVRVDCGLWLCDFSMTSITVFVRTSVFLISNTLLFSYFSLKRFLNFHSHIGESLKKQWQKVPGYWVNLASSEWLNGPHKAQFSSPNLSLLLSCDNSGSSWNVVIDFCAF